MEGPCDSDNPLTTPSHVATNVTGGAGLIGSTTPAPEGVKHGSEVSTHYHTSLYSLYIIINKLIFRTNDISADT